MALVLDFKKVYREKVWNFEKKMLKELSLPQLKKYIQTLFDDYSVSGVKNIEDNCLEIAVESFLLGAKYSRFGYLGEKAAYVKLRSQREEKRLIESLHYCCNNYFCLQQRIATEEHIHLKCEQLVDYWWHEGFRKGERRYKLRQCR